MKFTQTLLGVATLSLMSQVQASGVYLEDCGKTAESYAFIVDASGSMMQTVGEMKEQARKENSRKEESLEVPMEHAEIDAMTRVALSKRWMQKTAEDIATQTQMQSGVYTVAPYTELIKFKQRTPQEMQQALQALPDVLEVFGRATWLGKRAQEKFNATLAHPEATVLITDGAFEVTEEYIGAVQALKEFYQANPTACIHIVSAAYTSKEQAAVQALAEVNRCARVERLEDLMRNEALQKNFVEQVYYRDCSTVERVEIRGVNFAFDQASIGENGQKILGDALKVIATRDPAETITIRGWTDWTGSDTYNAGLSQRRAEAVKAYFVEHGVDPTRLQAEGMGKSFKYTNHTGDGRWMNRRVELIFGDGLKSTDATRRIAE